MSVKLHISASVDFLNAVEAHARETGRNVSQMMRQAFSELRERELSEARPQTQEQAQ